MVLEDTRPGRPVAVRSVTEVLAIFETQREWLGVGKTRLAGKAGYSKRIYGDWARGDITNPHMGAVLDYADALGLQLLVGLKS
jgi:hypothetical protein